jgi:hypothetical protein
MKHSESNRKATVQIAGFMSQSWIKMMNLI